QTYYVHGHRYSEASGKRPLKASLVELVWTLTERFPELRDEFRDHIALSEASRPVAFRGSRRQWPIAAAHAALGFFTHPSHKSFQQLLKAAAKAGCEDSIRGIALNFLETGVSPLSPPSKASPKSVANAQWPL